MIHVVLYQPEIPPNAGNVIRLCANTGSRLHLVRPLGFRMDDARLKRAGLDYREWASVREYDSLAAVLEALGDTRLFAFTTKAARPHTEPSYQPGDTLLFGPESRGLPDEVLESIREARRLRIPMVADSRSLNLSNAVAVAVFEAWRQLGFPGAE